MSLRFCSPIALSTSFFFAISSVFALSSSAVGVGSMVRITAPLRLVSIIFTFAQPGGGVSPMWVVPISSTHLYAAPAAPA